MGKTVNDLEREFLISQLGVSGVGKTLDDLRYDFYTGAAAGDISFSPTETVMLDMNNDVATVSGVRKLVGPWDIEIVDEGGMHSPANNNRIIIPSTGIYTIEAVLNVQGNAAGTRSLEFWTDAVGGSSAFFIEAPRTPPGAVSYNHFREMTMYCPAGTVFEVYFTQTSGVNLNIFGFTLSRFAAHKLRDA